MNAELKAELFGYLDKIGDINKENKFSSEITRYLRKAIAKLEALAPTAERELAIVRATQSAINSAMFEEYGTSTGVRVDPATILKCL